MDDFLLKTYNTMVKLPLLVAMVVFMFFIMVLFLNVKFRWFPPPRFAPKKSDPKPLSDLEKAIQVFYGSVTVLAMIVLFVDYVLPLLIRQGRPAATNYGTEEFVTKVRSYYEPAHFYGN